MQITVRVDDAAVRAGLRQSRTAIRQDIKRTFDEAARKHTKPVAMLIAPSVARPFVTTRGTTSGAWLGTTARG